MSNHQTVFYSWQSDCPAKLNRNFIEAALKEAIAKIAVSEVALESASRNEIKLDKDTAGVPGSPPITDTILKKIEVCSAFVADLTFVGVLKPHLKNKGKKPRQFSNPNVLLEHGYALRVHGHSRMIGVVNAAFGDDLERDLPFDLRHLRHPIRYVLREGDDKAAVKKDLVSDLVNALKPILNLGLPDSAKTPAFLPANIPISTWGEDAAAGDLIPSLDPNGTYPWPQLTPSGLCFLRIYPRDETGPIQTDLEALRLVRDGRLRPMSPEQLKGSAFDRNKYGAIAFERPGAGMIRYFTQLFLPGEIYGVDANSMHTLEWRRGELARNPINLSEIETSFAFSLRSFLKFASKQLKQRGPWQIEAGLDGTNEFESTNGKRCHKPSITWKATTDGTQQSEVVLKPFFELLWNSFGETRPLGSDEALTSVLSNNPD